MTQHCFFVFFKGIQEIFEVSQLEEEEILEIVIYIVIVLKELFIYLQGCAKQKNINNVKIVKIENSEKVVVISKSSLDR